MTEKGHEWIGRFHPTRILETRFDFSSANGDTNKVQGLRWNDTAIELLSI